MDRRENWVYKDPELQGQAKSVGRLNSRMVTVSILVTFLLTVGNFAHCQDLENYFVVKMEELLENQEAALNQLKKQEAALKDIWARLQTLEGTCQKTKDCVGKEDFESLKNISTAGHHELKSSLRLGISGVISLLETGGIDECSEGSYDCGDHEACTDKLFKYGCSCLPGFARDGSRCEDIDECALGKAECSPHAVCRNSVGSYSCSCNPTFEGDGRTCSCPPGFIPNGSHCEKFSCESPAKVLEGLGCVKLVREGKTWQEMNATCREAGWRLLQDFSFTSLQEIGQAFSTYGSWLGVYEGKWLESGIPVGVALWEKGYQADPSRRCGVIGWDSSSPSLYKLTQVECSYTDWGLCQFQST